MNKVYIVFMFSNDDNDYNQFVGVFDSKEKVEQAKQDICKVLELDLIDDDFDITETDINKNWIV